MRLVFHPKLPQQLHSVIRPTPSLFLLLAELIRWTNASTDHWQKRRNLFSRRFLCEINLPSLFRAAFPAAFTAQQHNKRRIELFLIANKSKSNQNQSANTEYFCRADR